MTAAARHSGGERTAPPGSIRSDSVTIAARLYRAAYAFCGSRQDAEDLVQDTYESHPAASALPAQRAATSLT